MAYAESTTRSRGRARGAAPDARYPRARHAVEPSELDEPEGTPHDGMDLRRASVVGGALALGVLVGAGAALLLAPQSGEELRAELADETRRFRGRAEDAWDDLRNELRWAARRGRRRVRRGVTRGGWAAEDVYDRGRRRVGR